MCVCVCKEREGERKMGQKNTYTKCFIENLILIYIIYHTDRKNRQIDE